MRVQIQHPTDKANFSIVKIGDSRLAFSYSTLIGVAIEFDRWKLTRNYWGPTTGKHLNYLDEDHSRRLTADEFAELVDSLDISVKVPE